MIKYSSPKIIKIKTDETYSSEKDADTDDEEYHAYSSAEEEYEISDEFDREFTVENLNNAELKKKRGNLKQKIIILEANLVKIDEMLKK